MISRWRRQQRDEREARVDRLAEQVAVLADRLEALELERRSSSGVTPLGPDAELDVLDLTDESNFDERFAEFMQLNDGRSLPERSGWALDHD